MPTDDGRRPEQQDTKLYCSFCNKSQEQVRKLIAGPKVYICEQCVDVCVDIIADDEPSPGGRGTVGGSTPLASPLLTARCSLCRTPAVVEELVAVISRGAVCRPCIWAIQAMPSSDGDAESPAE